MFAKSRSAPLIVPLETLNILSALLFLTSRKAFIYGKGIKVLILSSSGTSP